MTLKEAVEQSSSIARREPQRGYSKKIDRLTGKVLSEMEYVFTPYIEKAGGSVDNGILSNNGKKVVFDTAKKMLK
ncbi:MAG: hypothetical protein Q4P08_06275 [Eubacteriales bacterium]|nr:hypothetical protein [Eubacteriales bacterium]